ncbi:nucleotidyltransferase domain-containing protein [Moraxella nasibovis]|uniref:nucleotidyltransferase family protein n=1 Tax=Moraxella nasibovis TaxID=2904120 RepID=UPI00240F1C1E|nr:nucleotidyltransferase domain-containing protein [Moraxella nasibovis]WFF38405.1 nucleotidyltransferase domain-containing protein [Moraxella nasibovis]
MRPSQIIQSKRNEIYAIAKQFSIDELKVFGSVANGTDTPTSDLDLLITPHDKTTLFDLCGLKMELEELLGISIDIVTPRNLPFQDALQTAKPL